MKLSLRVTLNEPVPLISGLIKKKKNRVTKTQDKLRMVASCYNKRALEIRMVLILNM